jgi:hypothetical protein
VDKEYYVSPRDAGRARYSRSVSPAIETIGRITSDTGARPLDQAVLARFERLIGCLAVSSSPDPVNLQAMLTAAIVAHASRRNFKVRVNIS